MRRWSALAASLVLACQPTPPPTPSGPSALAPKAPPEAPKPPAAPKPPTPTTPSKPALHASLEKLAGPGYVLQKAHTLTINRTPVLHIGLLTHKDKALGLIVDADLSPTKVRRLQHTTSIEPLGIRDLKTSGPLRLSQTRWDLTTRNIQDPVLLLAYREKEAVAPNPRSRPSRRATGIRTARHLMAFDVHRGLTLMLRTTISRRSPDGFGGMNVSQMRLERDAKGAVTLRAMRQDRLPSFRSRCKRPKPYEVAFALRERHFQKLPGQRPSLPCR